MADNFSNDSLNSSTDAPLDRDIYDRPDYARWMNDALCGLLQCTDDSDLSYSDGRHNVVQVQLMDALAFTAHKQIEFHQRMLDQDVRRYRTFLANEYTPGNEISDQKEEQFQEQITRNEKAIAVYGVLKEQAVKLYLNITALAEWKPFNERTKAGPPSNSLASAKIAELNKKFGVPQPAEQKAATA